MTNKKIRDASLIPALLGAEQIEIDNNSSSFLKTNPSQIGKYANTVQEYSELNTADKTIVGAINEGLNVYKMLNSITGLENLALTELHNGWLYPVNADEGVQERRTLLYQYNINNHEETNYPVTIAALNSSNQYKSSVIFNGTLLNNLSVSGNYTGIYEKRFLIRIDTVGGYDTFKWSNDDGINWNGTEIAITGTSQLLTQGISIQFASITGHGMGSSWYFTVSNKSNFCLINGRTSKGDQLFTAPSYYIRITDQGSTKLIDSTQNNVEINLPNLNDVSYGEIYNFARTGVSSFIAVLISATVSQTIKGGQTYELQPNEFIALTKAVNYSGQEFWMPIGASSASSTTPSHNDLSGLQGGSAIVPKEYYHMTNAQHSSLINIPNSNEKSALDGANSPSVSNVFATMNDLVVASEKTENLPILSDGQTAFVLTKGTPLSDDAFHIFLNGVQVYTYTRIGINVTWDGITLRTSLDGLVAVYNRIESSTPVKSVFGRYGDISQQAGDYNKSQVGLGSVDNTSDADKPISTLTATALSGKEPTLTKGNLSTSTAGVSVGSGSNAVIGSGTTVNVSSASTSSQGLVQLSNSYNGTSQTLGVTEKALSDGLALKQNSFQKSFFIQAETASALGNRRDRSIGGSGSFNFNFILPSDFSSFGVGGGVWVLGFPGTGAPGTLKNIDLTLENDGGIGTLRNLHTNSDTISTYTIPAVDILFSTPIHQLITNAIAGVTGGVNINHNAIGGSISYIGILIKYQ
jgi:hypothetical protein